MKKLIISAIACGIAFASIAQKGKKEKTEYSYERNPYTKLDQSLTFDRIITYDYQEEQSVMKKEYNKALERARLDQAYYRDILGYEDPALRQVQAPPFKGDPQEANISSINIDGFNYASGGDIKVMVHFSDYNPTVTIQQDANTGKWKVSYNMSQAVTLKVEGPNGAILVEKSFTARANGSKKYTTNALANRYKKSIEADNNVVLKPEYNKVLLAVNNTINYNIGYSKASREDILFTAKGPKALNYQDVNVAYVNARTALGLIANNRSEGITKLQQCIADWDKVLTEANPTDKKARINADVTAAIRLNKALAFIHLRKYSDAETELAQVEVDPTIKRKYRKEAEDLAAFVADEKKRNQ